MTQSNLLLAAALLLKKKKILIEQLLERSRKKDVMRRRRDYRKKALKNFNSFIDSLRSDNELFTSTFKMSISKFDDLYSIISPFRVLKKSLVTSRPDVHWLYLYLIYVSSGISVRALCRLFSINHTTCLYMFPLVTDSIVSKLDNINLPNSYDEWLLIRQSFIKLYDCPAFGAIDGKHIRVKSFAKSGSSFHNYKCFFSFVLLGFCDANLRILFVDIGGKGRSHDSNLFEKTSLAAKLRDPNFLPPAIIPPFQSANCASSISSFILGDCAFKQTFSLMKPIPNANSLRCKIYNYRISRARRVIENVFGVMVARFRILSRPIDIGFSHSKKLILALSMLHNFLIDIPQECLVPVRYSPCLFTVSEQQDFLVDYFNNVFCVSGQEKAADK